jgi:putative glycosyltransferase
MDLSVVTTMYRSAPYLRESHARTVAAAGQIGQDFELVFVDDGSPDESLAVALELPLVVIDVQRASSTSRGDRGVMLRRQGDGGVMPLKPTMVLAAAA